MSDLMWMISNNVINVVDVLIVVLMPWVMVDAKREKKHMLFTVVVLTVILGLCNVYTVGSIGNIIFIFCAYFVVLLAIHEKLFKVSVWITIALTAEIFIDAMVVGLLTVVTQKPNYLVELNSQKNPAFIACCILVKVFDILFFVVVARKKILLCVNTIDFLLYLSLPATSSIIALIMINQTVKGRASGSLFLSLMIFVIVCNVLSIMIINSAAKNAYETERAKSQAKINQMDRMQYIKLAEKSDSIRAWKHDVRQVMNGALTMIQQGRDEEAELILKSKLSTMQVETTAIKSGNIIVDAILTKVVDECLDKNIPLVMRAEIPSAIMSEDDTCEVLGTLLDSAINVSCKQNDRKIDFMMQGGEQFRIQISTNAVLYSDKEKNALKETENRISKVLSKYNGIVSAKYDDEQKVVVWTLLVPLQKDIVWLTTYVYDTTDVVGETGNEQTEKELV